jgi:hypothetical protein
MAKKLRREEVVTHVTGAKRSARKPRYDLIPTIAVFRLAERFTGEMGPDGPTGGALKYGANNWRNGLPTSDVYNHVIDHLIHWARQFQDAQFLYGDNMVSIRKHMEEYSAIDDHLAGAMWGLCVLMHQEDTTMYFDPHYRP